jgi:hypothetical protein
MWMIPHAPHRIFSRILHRLQYREEDQRCWQPCGTGKWGHRDRCAPTTISVCPSFEYDSSSRQWLTGTSAGDSASPVQPLQTACCFLHSLLDAMAYKLFTKQWKYTMTNKYLDFAILANNYASLFPKAVDTITNPITALTRNMEVTDRMDHRSASWPWGYDVVTCEWMFSRWFMKDDSEREGNT